MENRSSRSVPLPILSSARLTLEFYYAQMSLNVASTSPKLTGSSNLTLQMIQKIIFTESAELEEEPKVVAKPSFSFWRAKWDS